MRETSGDRADKESKGVSCDGGFLLLGETVRRNNGKAQDQVLNRTSRRKERTQGP